MASTEEFKETSSWWDFLHIHPGQFHKDETFDRYQVAETISVLPTVVRAIHLGCTAVLLGGFLLNMLVVDDGMRTAVWVAWATPRVFSIAALPASGVITILFKLIPEARQLGYSPPRSTLGIIHSSKAWTWAGVVYCSWTEEPSMLDLQRGLVCTIATLLISVYVHNLREKQWLRVRAAGNKDS